MSLIEILTSSAIKQVSHRYCTAPPSSGVRPQRGKTSMTLSNDWAAQAACRTTDPDTLFVQGAAQNRVKAICLGCTVRTECLADALDNNVEFGVWGGMTERERRALLRRRPHVTSWRNLLETAQSEFERQSLLVEPVSRVS